MDAHHEAELRRILENRKQRGALKNSEALNVPVAQQPEPAVASSSAPPPPTRNEAFTSSSSEAGPPLSRQASEAGSLRMGSSSPPSNRVLRTFSNPNARFFLDPQPALARTGSEMSPSRRHQQRVVSFLRPREDIAEMTATAVTSTTERLREAQALQEKKVDQIQQDLHRGLDDIRKTLRMVLQEQRQHPPAQMIPLAAAYTTSGVMNSMDSVVDDEGGDASFISNTRPLWQTSIQPSGRRVDTLNGLNETPRGAASSRVLRSGQELTLVRTPAGARLRGSEKDPTDVQLVSGVSGGPPKVLTSALEIPASPLVIPGHFGAANVRWGGQPRSSDHRGGQPEAPPRIARPFMRSTIDLTSSMTILREGEWWYKWSADGVKVKPRWVWMDSTRRCLSWAEKQPPTQSPMFGPRIRLEDVRGVTSSDLHETDAHGNPRLFYILVVDCTTRSLQLGTERRDKMDKWYDALQNVVSHVMRLAQQQYSDSLQTE